MFMFVICNNIIIIFTYAFNTQLLKIPALRNLYCISVERVRVRITRKNKMLIKTIANK